MIYKLYCTVVLVSVLLAFSSCKTTENSSDVNATETRYSDGKRTVDIKSDTEGDIVALGTNQIEFSRSFFKEKAPKGSKFLGLKTVIDGSETEQSFLFYDNDANNQFLKKLMNDSKYKILLVRYDKTGSIVTEYKVKMNESSISKTDVNYYIKAIKYQLPSGESDVYFFQQNPETPPSLNQ